MKKAAELKNLKEWSISKEGKRQRWLDRCYRLALLEGISMDYLLAKKGIRRYAIYGYNEFARILVYSSMREDHDCVAIIDRNAVKFDFEFPVYELNYIPESDLKSIDAIIVCVVNVDDELIDEIERRTNAKVFCFEDIIYEI